MTKEKLEQLIDLRKEIKEIERRLNRNDTKCPLGNAELLEERVHMAAELEREITAYINSVGDSRIRRIMQYKYVDGYTWRKIANIMHYDRSYPEKAITRYLSKHS
ncbi:MAG: hypothetical protein K1W30_13795 [Lachnospiraceae bacterium]